MFASGDNTDILLFTSGDTDILVFTSCDNTDILMFISGDHACSN